MREVRSENASESGVGVSCAFNVVAPNPAAAENPQQALELVARLQGLTTSPGEQRQCAQAHVTQSSKMSMFNRLPRDPDCGSRSKSAFGFVGSEDLAPIDKELP